MSNLNQNSDSQPENSSTAAEAVTATLIDSQAFLSVTGPDALKLLQGQLTADLTRLADGETSGAALCNPKGRVISLMRLQKSAEGFLIRTHRENRPILQATLEKYGVFFKTKIQPEDSYKLLLLANAAGHEINAAECLISRPDGTLECWLTAEALDEFCSTLDCSPDNGAWLDSQIRCGEASITGSTAELFLPHALSLDLAGLVSFKKGCYTGQEIIARTQYRGKSKRRLAAIQCQPVKLAPGDDLSNNQGQSVAQVVLSVCHSDASLALISAVEPLSLDEGLLHGNVELNVVRLSLPWETE